MRATLLCGLKVILHANHDGQDKIPAIETPVLGVNVLIDVVIH